jgi:hypothetical protein
MLINRVAGRVLMISAPTHLRRRWPCCPLPAAAVVYGHRISSYVTAVFAKDIPIGDHPVSQNFLNKGYSNKSLVIVFTSERRLRWRGTWPQDSLVDRAPDSVIAHYC